MLRKYPYGHAETLPQSLWAVRMSVRIPLRSHSLLRPRCANLSKKHKQRDERLKNLGDDVREWERLALFDKNFLTIADAARRLQMSRNTLYKIIKEDDIP